MPLARADTRSTDARASNGDLCPGRAGRDAPRVTRARVGLAPGIWGDHREHVLDASTVTLCECSASTWSNPWSSGHARQPGAKYSVICASCGRAELLYAIFLDSVAIRPVWAPRRWRRGADNPALFRIRGHSGGREPRVSVAASRTYGGSERADLKQRTVSET
jgi:hypothetical protein